MANLAAAKDEVEKAARDKGASPEVLEAVREKLDQEFPDKTYEVGVWFLGFAALVLVIAGVLTIFVDEAQAPEWLTVSIGVAVGALAGIFKT